MINCKLCNKEFIDYTCGFGRHLTTIHKITTKEYYDKYFKQNNEGICIVCSKPTTFMSITRKYAKCCSIKCTNRSEIHKQKIKNTKEIRYNDPNYANREKYKQTMLNKYGVTHNWSGSLREKEKQTWIEKYGVDNPWKNKNIQEKCRQSFAKTHNGCTTPFEVQEIQQKAEKLANTSIAKKKANKTKELNNHRSKLELYFKKYLDSLNIIYEEEYSSDKYPFNCDFYIPKLDLYIELNNYWMHGNHKFGTNKNDKIILNKWIEKAKINKGYKSAINIWTVRDINKFKIAKKNKLNYKVLYTKKEIDQFLKELSI